MFLFRNSGCEISAFCLQETWLGEKELYLARRSCTSGNEWLQLPRLLPYKNKGEMNDCNNYRGISLRSIVGKVFARVILIRLRKLADRIYPESQCGFRAERTTTYMIFSLRQLQEKCRKHHMLSLISLRHLI